MVVLTKQESLRPILGKLFQIGSTLKRSGWIEKGIERLRETKKENRERGENERRERLRMNEINGERIK